MPANKTVYIIKDHVGMYYSTGTDGKECWVFGPLNAKQFDTIPKIEFTGRTVEVCELYISYFVKPGGLDWEKGIKLALRVKILRFGKFNGILDLNLILRTLRGKNTNVR